MLFENLIAQLWFYLFDIFDIYNQALLIVADLFPLIFDRLFNILKMDTPKIAK